MRKITSLLMLLCMFVGTAWATVPVDGKLYRIKDTSRSKYLTIAEYDKNSDGAFGTVPVIDKVEGNMDQAWSFEEESAGKYYLKSKSGYYLTLRAWCVDATIDGKGVVTLEQTEKDGEYYLKNGNQYFKVEEIAGDGGKAHPFCDATKDKAATWVFEEASASEFPEIVTVKYSFTYEGVEKYSQTSNVQVGADFPAITVNFPMGVVATKPEGTVTEATTKVIPVSIDNSKLPFVAAKDYNSIEHWYYMKIRDDGPTYAYYDSSIEYIKADASAYDKKSKDVYSWAFIGNPIDGFSVVNRAAGATKVLSSPKAPTANANADELARMVTAETAKGNTVWTVMNPTHEKAPAGSFYLQHPTASAYAINRQGFNSVNTLCYWNQRDLGSSFQIEERPMGAVAELEALIEEAEALLTSMKANEGTLMGQYSAATITTFETAISTAKNLDEAAITSAHVEALQAAMDAVKRNLPTTGKYYLIHSSLSKFAEHQAGKVKAAYSDGTNVNWTTANEDDKTFYWQAVATNDGGVVFQNAKDGKFMTGNKDRSGAWTVSDTYTDAAKLDMRLFAKDANDAKKHEYGVILNGWQMHCNGHTEGMGESGNVVSWNTDKANSASSWYVVEVELPVFYDVIYNFVYNGEVKFSQTSSIKPGGAYPDIVVPVVPYGVTTKATKPEGTVTKTEVINFELTVEHELPFKTATSVGNITTWYYAQMHANSNVTSYVEDNKNENNNVEWADKTVAADEIDSHLWGFVGDIWSGIKMVNKGTGRAIVSTSGDAVMGDAASATAFVPVYSNAAYRDGWFCLKYPNNADHLNASSGKISSWWDDDNGSSFFLTEYKETEVVVSAADYATLYLGQATYIPEGVEVYAVTGIEGNWATMTAVEGVLPANTGVILKNAGTYTFKTAGATGSVEGNLLRGSVEDTYVEGLAYVLANGTEGVGLYRAKLNMNAEGAEGTTHFLNNANKAYLPKPAEASARFISFDFGTETAIESIEGAEAENAVVYDLSGRRVQKAQKGVFIVNGKVVIK